MVPTFFELVARTWSTLDQDLKLSDKLGFLFVGLLAFHAAVYFTREKLLNRIGRVPMPVYAFALGLGAAIALFFTPIATAPFIYFQF